MIQRAVEIGAILYPDGVVDHYSGDMGGFLAITDQAGYSQPGRRDHRGNHSELGRKRK